ncbi:MAG: transglutaminaseTgpA domain-containing protein [Desulfuromonadaceae bacterium]
MLRIKTLLDILCFSAVILGLAPLFVWLDPAVKMIVVIAVIAGIVAEWSQRHWLTEWSATLLTLIFFALSLARIDLNSVVTPAVNLLALLLSIRLLTEKRGRHYLQIFVLALFCLAGSSLLSLGILYFPALILMVFVVTIGLVLLTFYSRDPGLRLERGAVLTLLKTAAILPVGSLFLMLALFFVLPRTQYPMWNFLNAQSNAVTGFSEQVRPGTFASNSATGNLAFRAECTQLPPEHLYWRGTVLNTPASATWRRTSPNHQAERVVGGTPIPCTITLPASDNRFLFTLDYPVKLEGIRAHQEEDLVFRTHRPRRKDVRYTCQARPAGELFADPDGQVDKYLTLPENIPPRVRQVAEQIRSRGKSTPERIQLLEEFFRSQKLTYANTDLPGPEAPVDEFLFDKKRGYCEFFASSFAQLLRLCEIPARLVGGYHGGDYNNFGDYYLVSEDMAHVWVEALVDGRWKRLDPSTFAHNAAAGFFNRRESLSAWRRTIDGLEFLWTQAIITYDLNKQLSLVRSGSKQATSLLARASAPATSSLVYTAAIIAGVILLGITICLGMRRIRLTPHQRLLQRYHKALQRRYHLEHIPATTALVEHAQELNDPDCVAFARRYSAIIYGNRPLSTAEYKYLSTLIQQIQKNNVS